MKNSDYLLNSLLSLYPLSSKITTIFNLWNAITMNVFILSQYMHY